MSLPFLSVGRLELLISEQLCGAVVLISQKPPLILTAYHCLLLNNSKELHDINRFRVIFSNVLKAQCIAIRASSPCHFFEEKEYTPSMLITPEHLDYALIEISFESSFIHISLPPLLCNLPFLPALPPQSSRIVRDDLIPGQSGPALCTGFAWSADSDRTAITYISTPDSLRNYSSGSPLILESPASSKVLYGIHCGASYSQCTAVLLSSIFAHIQKGTPKLLRKIHESFPLPFSYLSSLFSVSNRCKNPVLIIRSHVLQSSISWLATATALSSCLRTVPISTFISSIDETLSTCFSLCFTRREAEFVFDCPPDRSFLLSIYPDWKELICRHNTSSGTDLSWCEALLLNKELVLVGFDPSQSTNDRLYQLCISAAKKIYLVQEAFVPEGYAKKLIQIAPLFFIQHFSHEFLPTIFSLISSTTHHGLKLRSLHQSNQISSNSSERSPLPSSPVSSSSSVDRNLSFLSPLLTPRYDLERNQERYNIWFEKCGQLFSQQPYITKSTLRVLWDVLHPDYISSFDSAFLKLSSSGVLSVTSEEDRFDIHDWNVERKADPELHTLLLSGYHTLLEATTSNRWCFIRKRDDLYFWEFLEYHMLEQSDQKYHILHSDQCMWELSKGLALFILSDDKYLDLVYHSLDSELCNEKLVRDLFCSLSIGEQFLLYSILGEPRPSVLGINWVDSQECNDLQGSLLHDLTLDFNAICFVLESSFRFRILRAISFVAFVSLRSHWHRHVLTTEYNKRLSSHRSEFPYWISSQLYFFFPPDNYTCFHAVHHITLNLVDLKSSKKFSLLALYLDALISIQNYRGELIFRYHPDTLILLRELYHLYFFSTENSTSEFQYFHFLIYESIRRLGLLDSQFTPGSDSLYSNLSDPSTLKNSVLMSRLLGGLNPDYCFSKQVALLQPLLFPSQHIEKQPDSSFLQRILAASHHPEQYLLTHYNDLSYSALKNAYSSIQDHHDSNRLLLILFSNFKAPVTDNLHSFTDLAYTSIRSAPTYQSIIYSLLLLLQFQPIDRDDIRSDLSILATDSDRKISNLAFRALISSWNNELSQLFKSAIFQNMLDFPLKISRNYYSALIPIASLIPPEYICTQLTLAYRHLSHPLSKLKLKYRILRFLHHLATVPAIMEAQRLRELLRDPPLPLDPYDHRVFKAYFNLLEDSQKQQELLRILEHAFAFEANSLLLSALHILSRHITSFPESLSSFESILAKISSHSDNIAIHRALSVCYAEQLQPYAFRFLNSVQNPRIYRFRDHPSLLRKLYVLNAVQNALQQFSQPDPNFSSDLFDSMFALIRIASQADRLKLAISLIRSLWIVPSDQQHILSRLLSLSFEQSAPDSLILSEIKLAISKLNSTAWLSNSSFFWFVSALTEFSDSLQSSNIIYKREISPLDLYNEINDFGIYFDQGFPFIRWNTVFFDLGSRILSAGSWRLAAHSSSLLLLSCKLLKNSQLSLIHQPHLLKQLREILSSNPPRSLYLLANELIIHHFQSSWTSADIVESSYITNIQSHLTLLQEYESSVAPFSLRRSSLLKILSHLLFPFKLQKIESLLSPWLKHLRALPITDQSHLLVFYLQLLHQPTEAIPGSEQGHYEISTLSFCSYEDLTLQEPPNNLWDPFVYFFWERSFPEIQEKSFLTAYHRISGLLKSVFESSHLSFSTSSTFSSNSSSSSLEELALLKSIMRYWYHFMSNLSKDCWQILLAWACSPNEHINSWTMVSHLLTSTPPPSQQSILRLVAFAHECSISDRHAQALVDIFQRRNTGLNLTSFTREFFNSHQQYFTRSHFINLLETFNLLPMLQSEDLIDLFPQQYQVEYLHKLVLNRSSGNVQVLLDRIWLHGQLQLYHRSVLNSTLSHLNLFSSNIEFALVLLPLLQLHIHFDDKLYDLSRKIISELRQCADFIPLLQMNDRNYSCLNEVLCLIWMPYPNQSLPLSLTQYFELPPSLNRISEIMTYLEFILMFLQSEALSSQARNICDTWLRSFIFSYFKPLLALKYLLQPLSLPSILHRFSGNPRAQYLDELLIKTTFDWFLSASLLPCHIIGFSLSHNLALLRKIASSQSDESHLYPSQIAIIELLCVSCEERKAEGLNIILLQLCEHLSSFPLTLNKLLRLLNPLDISRHTLLPLFNLPLLPTTEIFLAGILCSLPNNQRDNSVIQQLLPRLLSHYTTDETWMRFCCCISNLPRLNDIPEDINSVLSTVLLRKERQTDPERIPLFVLQTLAKAAPLTKATISAIYLRTQTYVARFFAWDLLICISFSEKYLHRSAGLFPPINDNVIFSLLHIFSFLNPRFHLDPLSESFIHFVWKVWEDNAVMDNSSDKLLLQTVSFLFPVLGANLNWKFSRSSANFASSSVDNSNEIVFPLDKFLFVYPLMDSVLLEVLLTRSFWNWVSQMPSASWMLVGFLTNPSLRLQVWAIFAAHYCQRYQLDPLPREVWRSLNTILLSPKASWKEKSLVYRLCQVYSHHDNESAQKLLAVEIDPVLNEKHNIFLHFEKQSVLTYIHVAKNLRQAFSTDPLHKLHSLPIDPYNHIKHPNRHLFHLLFPFRFFDKFKDIPFCTFMLTGFHQIQQPFHFYSDRNRASNFGVCSHCSGKYSETAFHRDILSFCDSGKFRLEKIPYTAVELLNQLIQPNLLQPKMLASKIKTLAPSLYPFIFE